MDGKTPSVKALKDKDKDSELNKVSMTLDDGTLVSTPFAAESNLFSLEGTQGSGRGS